MLRVLILSAIISIAYIFESRFEITRHIGQDDQNLQISLSKLIDPGLHDALSNHSKSSANIDVEQVGLDRLDSPSPIDYMTFNGDFNAFRQFYAFISRIHQARFSLPNGLPPETSS